MRRPLLLLELDGSLGRSGYLQPLADLDLWSDRPIQPGARPAPRPDVPDFPSGGCDPDPVFDDAALLEGELQPLRVSRLSEGGYRVRFVDGETFDVSAEGDRVVRRGGATGGPDTRLLSRALGPPLALALAVRGIHLLHASAVTMHFGALALTAPSGGGKSTLAAAAVARPGHGLRRAGDDILAVRLGDRPRVLPAFPQLKLGDPSAYPEDLPTSLPLLGLLELERRPGPSECGLSRLSVEAAFRSLTHATVAARLFDRDLLAAHFDLATRTARDLPVFRLSYPSGFEHLDRVLDELEHLAGSLAPGGRRPGVDSSGPSET